MKKVLLFCISAIMLISCSESKKSEEKAEPVETQVKSAAVVDPKEQKLQELRKAPLTSLDDMQKMLPEVLAGIKKTKFSMTSNMNYGMVNADYTKNANTFVQVTMYDCAGEDGAKLYQSSFQNDLGKADSTEKGYMRTIELQGGKAIERFDAELKVTTLSFLANDKILFVIAGKNIEADALKEEVQKMNVKISG